MKGVYSSPDSVNQRAVQHSLFPDNTYGEDSGGDPKVIPQLTFEEFQVLLVPFGRLEGLAEVCLCWGAFLCFLAGVSSGSAFGFLLVWP